MKKEIAAAVALALILPAAGSAQTESRGWQWWQKKDKPAPQTTAGHAMNLPEQQSGIKENRESVHQKRIAKLRANLDKDGRLNEADKSALIAIYERHYNERIAREDKHRVDNRAFLEKLQTNANMTHEQKKAAIEEHFEQFRAELRELKTREREEVAEFWKDIRARAPHDATEPSIKYSRTKKTNRSR